MSLELCSVLISLLKPPPIAKLLSAGQHKLNFFCHEKKKVCKKEFQPVADKFQISDRYMYPEDFNSSLYLSSPRQNVRFELPQLKEAATQLRTYHMAQFFN